MSQPDQLSVGIDLGEDRGEVPLPARRATRRTMLTVLGAGVVGATFDEGLNLSLHGDEVAAARTAGYAEGLKLGTEAAPKLADQVSDLTAFLNGPIGQGFRRVTVLAGEIVTPNRHINRPLVLSATDDPDGPKFMATFKLGVSNQIARPIVIATELLTPELLMQLVRPNPAQDFEEMYIFTSRDEPDAAGLLPPVAARTLDGARVRYPAIVMYPDSTSR